MNKNPFEIQGITHESCIPECEPEIISQICETDVITIHAKDPDIHEIIRINVSVCLRNFKIIKSVPDKKLIIYALKNIELIFKAGGVRYVSNYCIPFCAFIMLDCEDDKVKNIKFVVEDIDAMQTSPRSVAVSSIIMIIPEFYGIKHGECETEGNSIRCDIKLKSGF